MGPTHVTIDHARLLNNYQLIKSTVGASVKIMAIVKANAYGHGLQQVTETLQKAGADYFGVAFPEEGIALRKAGIKKPILVMGAHLNDYIEQQLDYKLDLTISHLDQLQYLNTCCTENNKQARIHLKIDSGMNRVGFNRDDFFKAYDFVSGCPRITVAGIYTHLSSSDEDDQSFTQLQLRRFREICDAVDNSDNSILFHMANSAGVLQSADYHLHMVRVGIILYGNPTSPGFNIDSRFKEVMSFHSRITLVREIAKNEPVSYNRRFYSKEKTKIAVIPVGYADGYNRLLTNNSFVLIQGKRYPQIGTVCMNQILVDLGKDSTIGVGEPVVLFGQQGRAHISISEIAERLNSIPYEVTCAISAQVPRVHVY